MASGPALTGQPINPAHELVTCVLCRRGATFTEDAVCRICRHNKAKERPTKADEVKR